MDLFLRRDLAQECRDCAPDWNRLSRCIGRLSGMEPGMAKAPSAADLAMASALQTAFSALTDACLSAQPHRLKNAWTGLRNSQPSVQAVLSGISRRWSVEPDGLPRAVLLLDVLASNPAFRPLQEPMGLDHARTGDLGAALSAFRRAEDELAPAPGFDAPLNQVLRRPARQAEASLSAQLEWVLENWREWLPRQLRHRLLRAMDLHREETRPRFSGPGPARAPIMGVSAAASHSHGDPGPGLQSGTIEGEHFSEDRDWMPNLVLIAKQSYVWLHQLSEKYQRPIHHLDQIPDRELDLLVSRGFNCLWLIGLWERSPASRRIKRARGNPEAEASAYSLQDYRIARRLGGDEALSRLRQRAMARGLRLAADMVPNHMGLDSRWMAEHPDYFLQLPEPPFPGYSFDGPDLSGDERIGVYLEDGYWDHSDAAVVFKCVERRTGRERYVYHGNDGTGMPWNDTAQLDFLKPQVRQAVIDIILDVARTFPVIRFDAAMTLATRHIRRLWHPPPGQGGAIPSRGEHALPPELFQRQLPGEFWRQVVERVGREAPDTLLLAEAFWMMEGFFVRELGMHRVYNSAFMHMLRDGDNAGFRKLIKDVLEYSPAILERFVNFMNNPDEDTAMAQFGKGDKYFGVVTLLAGLPGLPMFGHGQVEGLSEKYGMEYARPYKDEPVDQGFLDHHEKLVFPVLRNRHLFSGVRHFALMDFVTDDGSVDENVYALVNGSVHSRQPSLLLFNNSSRSSRGRIKRSVPMNLGEPGAPRLVCRELHEALGLENREGLLALRELGRGAWTIRSIDQVVRRGFRVELAPYEAMVFMELRELPEGDSLGSRLPAPADDLWIPDLDAHRDLSGAWPTAGAGAPGSSLDGAPPAERVVAVPPGRGSPGSAEQSGASPGEPSLENDSRAAGEDAAPEASGAPGTASGKSPSTTGHEPGATSGPGDRDC